MWDAEDTCSVACSAVGLVTFSVACERRTCQVWVSCASRRELASKSARAWESSVTESPVRTKSPLGRFSFGRSVCRAGASLGLLLSALGPKPLEPVVMVTTLIVFGSKTTGKIYQSDYKSDFGMRERLC